MLGQPVKRPNNMYNLFLIVIPITVILHIASCTLCLLGTSILQDSYLAHSADVGLYRTVRAWCVLHRFTRSQNTNGW